MSCRRFSNRQRNGRAADKRSLNGGGERLAWGAYQPRGTDHVDRGRAANPRLQPTRGDDSHLHSGPFTKPKVHIGPRPALRAGAAAALAPVSPILAVLPLIETGLGEGGVCRKYIETLKMIETKAAH